MLEGDTVSINEQALNDSEIEHQQDSIVNKQSSFLATTSDNTLGAEGMSGNNNRSNIQSVPATSNLSGTSQHQSQNVSQYLFGGQNEQNYTSIGDVKHFVGGFGRDVNEEHLRAWFSKFGGVAEVKIMRNPLSGQSRGFGFVTMTDSSSKAAILKEKDHVICGKKVSVRPYTEADVKESYPEGLILKRKIFVGGINPVLGQEVLVKFFERFGQVEDASIMRYPDGRSRGFGFIVFREEIACQQALQQRNYYVTPRDKVEVKPCLSRVRTKAGMSMMTEPYYRYGQVGTSNFGSVPAAYNQGNTGYGSSGGVGYFNSNTGGLYNQYNRTAAYDGYAAPPHNTIGWNSGDNRDWWGSYDSYANFYGGTGNYWPSGGYNAGLPPGYNMYGGTVSRSGGNLDSSQMNASRVGSSNLEIPYHDSSAATTMNSVPPAAGGAPPQMAGSNASTHHTYGPLRRTGTNMPMMSMYSMPRGRGNAY